ncbi:3-phytase [Janthinobacterium sp. CG_23.3]|uniref:phytase n=1 Tax=Janthinobacterium sp. CG_23.3 TaxID=3349634 RepID=UPI0038D460AC
MKTIPMKAALGAALLAATTLAQAGAATPGATARADELAALPGGGWLSLDKRGLHLLDAAGKERATLPMRAKQLDTRSHADGALAVVLEADTQRPLAVMVDLKAGELRAQAPFPVPGFGVEASCLYRDAQQVTHLFLIGKDGQSEQWLMHGDQRQLVRKLALPPHAKHCRADDASHTLLVSESGIGLWAYEADAESAGRREPVALRRPFGQLDGGAGALAVLPGGVAVLDAKGKRLHLLRRRDGKWQALPPQPTRSAKGAGQLALRAGAGGIDLLLRDEAAGNWQIRPQSWQAARPAPVATTMPMAVIEPRGQTEPMARAGDAADDPAIWVHPNDPAASRILGTNKKQGLLVYDLQGKQRQLLEVGRLNNVDLRQNVTLDGQRVDLAVASQRDDNSMMLFTIDAQGIVSEAARLPTDLERIYGICLYQPAGGGLEAFVNDKDGSYRHYRIERHGQGYASTLLRRFSVASQPEGCVVDDRRARLYIGEEKRGVWAGAADASAKAGLQLILPLGPHLSADVEGLALYHGAKGDYLIVSSQGNNSYVVLDAAAPNRVRGTFRVGYNLAAGIDGTSETDGLDASSANLGGAYASGMLVIQDGYKRLPDGPQNFKYVAWEDIARALKLP